MSDFIDENIKERKIFFHFAIFSSFQHNTSLEYVQSLDFALYFLK